MDNKDPGTRPLEEADEEEQQDNYEQEEGISDYETEEEEEDADGAWVSADDEELKFSQENGIPDTFGNEIVGEDGQFVGPPPETRLSTASFEDEQEMGQGSWERPQSPEPPRPGSPPGYESGEEHLGELESLEEGQQNEWDGEGYGTRLDVLYEGEAPGEYEQHSIRGSPAATTSTASLHLEEALSDMRESLQYLPPRKESEQQFHDEYMRSVPTSAENLRARLSLEAVNLPSRQSTPSPPSTPKKTLRRMHECPSVESFFKLGDPVRVHFVVLPGQKMFALEARMDRTILDLKKEISPICRVPVELIDLRKNRNLVMDYKTLRDLGAKPRKKMKFTIEVSKRCSDEYKLQIPQEAASKQKPSETRKVQVATKKGIKTVKVEVEYPSETKPFIGGYRDKRNDTLYHNADTQTPVTPRTYSENVSHFSCQTFDNTWKTMQTMVDTYAQTTRPDYYISALNQKIITPKIYVTAEQVEQKRIQSAIIIQKYWRRWLAKKERARRLEGLVKRVEWAENVRKGRTEARLAIKEDEMWRQNHPTRMVDVELLYRAINEWRNREVEYVNLHRWGADRKAALAEIMEKEADLLLDLERTKSAIRKNMREAYVEQIFKKMGEPTKWLNKIGNFVAMDTQAKASMRHYHELYNELKERVTDNEKRVDVLNRLMGLIKTCPARPAKNLAALIDRELQLIEFKAGPRLMVGLRQRVLNTFYTLIRDPIFNPEARKLQKVPFDTKKLRKDMVQCKGCRKVQYRAHFTVERGVTISTRCTECTALYRTCILRSDLNLYRRMLTELRHDEQALGVNTSVTYLIDAYDLQFLIEQLWHGQSALSGINDRYLLRICRWKKNEPWTPWNCVLLTEEEAVAHLHLDSVEKSYQKSFLHKIEIKHQAAKIYFARLSVLSLPLDPLVVEKCEDYKRRLKMYANEVKTNVILCKPPK